MKKRKIVFTLICFLMIFILTGCGGKRAISTKDFKSKAKSNNYVTYNVIDQFSSYAFIKEATVAKSKDGFTVEFYVLDDDLNATNMFNTNKKIFESYKSNSSSESSLAVNNYSTYTLTTGGYYMYICKVHNTLLYAKVKDTYKNSVKSFIKELGY